MNWLLLRGLSRDQRHWGEFPALFESAVGGEVRRLDPPGFGTEHRRTAPLTLRAITDDLRARFEPGDADWSILGISLGGMIAMDWMSRYPNDFHRGVLINTSSAASPLHHRFRLGSLPVLAATRLLDPVAAERAILAVACNSTEVPRAELARRWAQYASEAGASSRSVAAQMLAAIGFRHPHRLPIPVLILASRGDRLVSHHCSERIAETLDLPLLLHDTAGHDLPLDDPTWICDRVTEWLA
ncbi:alpha/beta fold hydrolase [Nocardia concava]|uniref:alpha/beta fold hydrolase n=1 Tax=Nocardia concava TaxID=257281 RepID=UPI0002F267F8|nr:alpha/beta hydrolase [Nocardia concava]